MRAFLISRAGGVEVLYEGLIDLPVLNADEVLVEVRAISINPADVKIRQDEQGLTMMAGDRRPLILGWDIAGIVADVGDEVTQFERGDRVFGMVNFPGIGNAYAEYVAAPAAHLGKIPETIGFEEAAAATLAALTAHQVLNGKVKSGDKVLVHAGSGGVGHFAVQIAKSLGATVITTSSAKNREYVLSIGADEHVDYRAQPFENVVSDVDFVFDTQGNDILARSVEVLRHGGQMVSIAAFSVPDDVAAAAAAKDAQVSTHMVTSSGEGMEALAGYLADGAIKPTIAKVFDFVDLADAHTEVERGRTVGKVIVRVS